ncbi:TPA: NADP-dependent glyceraldehyde-3-phosphate dehydrogenase [Patescibacteria group bacterium]|uniref:Aldehyde dehydrogenase domain-containing protein n=1 Tax=Candidatus Gottesmanbacteria bacterium GW2011_GWA1_43_11 TaxID=1618436 RepID=A0A0G1CEW4_9BACT|nr:MAG: hypothetical protein UV59_C0021G0011 [Candidatus Gottesmanbacteria bacterium GW2011_GWA1_43_11]HCS78478.1 NADP-dependent glyceraldehyde-3-phosphate dehydrogenase [Patescibacteria group bacterium]
MPDDIFAELHDNQTPPLYRWFNGHAWVESKNGHYKDVVSPIDHTVLGKFPVVTTAEIDDAIARAHGAQRLWARVEITKRGKVLRLAADWIREHEPLLTTLLIKEIGKPADEAKDEIVRSADMLDYYTHEALHVGGEQLPSDAFPGYDQSKISIIERVPQGVVLAISPFNYPVNLSVSKLAPALMMGNAVIFKPPTNGALSALYLTQIFRKAGVPDDLLVTVTGGGEDIGDYLVGHPGINMITFTGSSQVGKSAAKIAGMIPLLFECGGNNAALVINGCDIETTALEIVKGAYSFAGQRCTAIKYVLGLDSDLDKVLPRVVALTQEKIKMGDPRDPGTKSVGPLITESAAKEVEARIVAAQQAGAKIVLGGKRQGNYIEPTILDHVTMDMEIVRIETFGPVVSFVRVKSIEEAIDLINRSTYGLQAAIYTCDEGLGIKLAGELDVGTVWINNKPQRGPDHFPFLGTKGSGVGVQGIKYSLEAMTRLKPIIINKPG